ncbi:MAG: outer membrane protein assembly factor BamE [Legionellales bacterium]|nr:outer membrane protein assembly factor BamE [Legionellales bacterium]
MKRLTRVIISGLAALLLSGCKPLLSQIHLVNIQQGNVITPQMVPQLHRGMTKAQVEEIMGTPVLNNTFRPNRWDYVYTVDNVGQPKFEKRVTIVFDQASRVSQIIVTN